MKDHLSVYSRETRLCLVIIALLGAFFLFPVSGTASSQPYLAGHAINFATGNKYQQDSDIVLAGRSSRLSFSRTYNSQSAESGALGFGWEHTYSDRLIISGSNMVRVLSGGRRIAFVNGGAGVWHTALGKKETVTISDLGYLLSLSDGTRRIYDSAGYLTQINFLNNELLTLVYASGRLQSVTDSFGASLNFSYNGAGLLTSLSSPVGTWQYSYVNGNLVTVIRPDAASRHYLYEDPLDAHNLTGIVNESGVRIQTLGYNSQDRVVTSSLAGDTKGVTIAYSGLYQRTLTDGSGGSRVFQLAAVGGVGRVVSSTGTGCSSCGAGNENSSFIYNDRQLISSSTNAVGVETSFLYDEKGNRISQTEAVGTPQSRVTTSTYDPVTNKVATISRPSVANPGQQAVETMTYDVSGNLLTRTQSGFSGTTAISRTTTYTYNGYGQITSIDGPRTDVNDTVSFTYYPNEAGQGLNRGQLQTITNVISGHVTSFAGYNAFGQTATITAPNNEVTTRSFDLMGRVTASVTAGLTTSYSYNTAGQLLSITRPGGRVISYSYTPDGQVATISDSQGNAIHYAYDSFGRRTGEEVRDPQNILTRFVNFGYDARGNLQTTTFPGGAVETAGYNLVNNVTHTVNATGMETDYTYDALNRLLSVIEGGIGTKTTTYDPHDNIRTVTDAKSRVTSFGLDDFGREVSVSAPDTGQSLYQYDTADNLLSRMDSREQMVSFTYDALNRPVSKVVSGINQVFTYDQGFHGLGRLSGISDEEGSESFGYDVAGRLVTHNRTIGGIPYSTGYNYAPTTGELSGMTYPSGMAVGYTRDANGQISGMTLNGAALVTNISRLPFGPLKSATLGSTGLTRSYDQRYNASRIKVGSLDYVYTRNAGGQATSVTGAESPGITVDTTFPYSYKSTNNQLISVPPKSYTYDAVGNMVSDGASAYTWDGLNRLIKVKKGSATVAEYGYDAANRRIRKTVGATTTHYLYDLNNQLIAETLANGTVLREYIYLDGEPLALKEYQTNPGTYYSLNDHLGTPQQLITATGNTVWQAAYLPFGQAQIKTATVANNLRFPGQYFDAETGLHYNWNRYYNPEVGRYVSADPIGLAGGMNLYSYVSNDPVNLTDPMGLMVYMCSEQADIPGNKRLGLRHVWLKTDTLEAGLGPAGGNSSNGSPYVTSTTFVDHSDRKGTCIPLSDIPEDCVNEKLKQCKGTPMGSWRMGNTCHSSVDKIVEQCKNRCLH